MEDWITDVEKLNALIDKRLSLKLIALTFRVDELENALTESLENVDRMDKFADNVLEDMEAVLEDICDLKSKFNF